MKTDAIFPLLDAFKIETPSWGYADTGTRFGKFFSARGRVDYRREARGRGDRQSIHRLLPDGGGACIVGLFSGRRRCADDRRGRQEKRSEDRLDQSELSSRIRSTSSGLRRRRTRERDNTPIAMSRTASTSPRAVDSKLLSLWFADGTNYPGQDDIVSRKHRMHGALRAMA